MTKAVDSGSAVDEHAASISPVLMSWMISAGFVLVFSAISFSVGYVWGKEVGKIEGSGGGFLDFGFDRSAGGGAGVGVGAGSGCGKEAAANLRSGSSGLRRLRWGSSGSASVRA